MAFEHDAWIKRLFGVDMATLTGAAAGRAIGARAAAAVAVKHGPPPVNAAAVLPGVTPSPRAGLGPVQVNRARELVSRMPPPDRDKVQGMVGKAMEGERPYLVKALASGHSAAELAAFHAQVAGKPQTWMRNNLHLVGNTHGKGVKQQWANSCVPTTVQAVRGELDPIYALRTNQQNPDLTRADDKDGMRLNPRLAAEQRAELRDSKSDGDNRAGTKLPHLGEGDRDIVKHLGRATGLKFTVKSVIPEALYYNDDKEMQAPQAMDEAIADVKSSLKAGLPVPLAVVKVSDGHEFGMHTKFKMILASHMVLCTKYEPGPPPRYTVHDPASGNTLVMTEAELRTGKLPLHLWTSRPGVPARNIQAGQQRVSDWDMQPRTRADLLARTPDRYLRGGYLDAAGAVRPGLLADDATAAATQLLAADASPQELAYTLEAVRQSLPLHGAAGPEARLRAALDEALAVVAGAIRQPNNPGLARWIGACAAAVRTGADLDAFLAHVEAALRQHALLAAMLPPTDPAFAQT